MSEHQVVVIGAGPSGVAVAVSLLDCGVRPLLVDRADYVGSSWRGRYDRLKLNTGRPLSHLPSRRYPQGTSIFPTPNDVAEHLHRHAHEDGIALRLATTVNRIDPSRVAGSYRRPLVILTRAKWSSPRGTSTRPSSPSGPEKTALLASCCIPPPTATQSLCGASEYWWSALARPDRDRRTGKAGV